MKLLAKIDAIEPTEEERVRLTACLLDERSIQRQLLTANAPLIRDFDFWRLAQKKFKVTGFRDGAREAIARVLQRALDNLKSKGPSAWPLMAPLYHRSLHLHLERDRPELHELLSREDFAEGAGTLTDQVLRCVVRKLAIHQATIESARELYEIWGLERSANAIDILERATVDPDTIHRIADDAARKSRREFAAAMAELRTELGHQVSRASAELASTRLELREIEKAVSQLEDRLEKLGKPYSAPTPDAAAILRSAGPRSTARSSTSDTRRDQAIASLEARQTALGRQLKELRIRMDRLSASAESNDLRPGVSTAPDLQSSLSQLVAQWTQSFSEIGIPSASAGSAILLLEIARRSRVVVSDMPRLFMALYDALPGAERKQIAASPIWIDVADWRAAYTFLRDKSVNPRLVILNDFDVAIQEAYLVPAIIEWLADASPSNTSRLVLVPARSDLESVSPRVFEFAPLLKRDSELVPQLKTLGSRVPLLDETLARVQPPSRLVSVIESRSVEYEEELNQFASSCGVALPPRLVTSFVNLYSGLSALTSAGTAGRIAQAAFIDPWVQTARGEAVSRTFSEALRGLFTSDN